VGIRRCGSAKPDFGRVRRRVLSGARLVWSKTGLEQDWSLGCKRECCLAASEPVVARSTREQGGCVVAGAGELERALA